MSHATQKKFRFNLARKPLAVREMFAASADKCVADYLYSLGYRSTDLREMSDENGRKQFALFALLVNGVFVVSVDIQEIAA